MPYKFEYFKDNQPQKLSEENHDFLVSHIAGKWDEWDSARNSNLNAISEVESAIYPSRKSKTSKLDISMPEIYEIRETYKAHLWKSWFSSLDTMFDVQGKNREDHYKAVKQKASLVNVFRDIDLVSKFEKGLDNWINKGEFIAFVNWSTKARQVRRKEYELEGHDLLPDWPDFIGDEELEAGGYYDYVTIEPQGDYNANGTRKLENRDIEGESCPRYVVKDEIIYDGPDITIISSESFVFDPAKKDDFEACPKIYRSWATYEEIVSNKLYENTAELADLVQEKENSDNKAVKGSQIEILEYWGDVKLKDGTLLKNQVITLAGRKQVIRFEQNPFIINPFVYAAFIEDPDTKRGYSPLYIALPLNEASETILNLQLDALKLIINKPYLAPRGSLSGKINVKEGAIIEYDPALMPREPVPLDFKDAIVGWDFLSYFENKIESTTGVYKYMIGSSKNMTTKTATEASGLMAGQNIRLSKEIDLLNHKVKVPVIKKVAELMANFSFDMEEIKISMPNGDLDFVFIDESVRQGNYEYIIGDATAIFERKTRLRESLDFLYEMAKLPEVAPRVRWIEVLKWAFEQLGSVDPNMFISDDPA